jgi:DNA-binding NarL/FixJ family response regulator
MSKPWRQIKRVRRAQQENEVSNALYDNLPQSVPLTEDIADPTVNVEQTVAHRQLLQRILDSFDERGQKILMMIAEGYTTEEIAEELELTPGYTRELVAAVRAKARGFKGHL